jgi:hypothetical protein
MSNYRRLYYSASPLNCYVYDSVPTSEWDETMNKMRAVFRAVTMAGLEGAIMSAVKVVMLDNYDQNRF